MSDKNVANLLAANPALGAFQLTGLDKYEGPSLLDRTAVLEVEGTSGCEITNGEYDIVGDPGKEKGQITWKVRLTDPDLLGGNAVIRARTFLNGYDKNNEPLARQTADLLVSAQTHPVQQIQQGAAAKAGMGHEELIKQMVGRKAFIRFKHGSYDKEGMRYPTTEGDGFITAQQYEDSKKNGQYRLPKPRNTAAQPIAGGAAGAGAVAVGPTGVIPGAGAPMPFGGAATAPAGGFGGAPPAPAGFPALANGAPGAPAGFPSMQR